MSDCDVGVVAWKVCSGVGTFGDISIHVCWLEVIDGHGVFLADYVEDEYFSLSFEDLRNSSAWWY